MKSAIVNAYSIQRVPRDLWDAVKHRAIDDGMTVRETVLSALSAYVGVSLTQSDAAKDNDKEGGK
jgi:hypothetical protein